MESVTKSRLSGEQIAEMAKRAVGENERLREISELTDGYYNSAYLLSFESGLRSVLKVSPMKNVKVMRYEKNLMEAEVYTLNQIISHTNVSVPRVLYYKKAGDIIENEYFFMEFIDGAPLNKAADKLTDDQKKAVSSKLAGFAKQIACIEGSYFGYISQEDKRFDTWSEAFLYMISELLEDASEAGVTFTLGYKELYALVDEKRDLLDVVKKPSLVHKDLWQGNIFVDPNTAKINGIVDCERAVYGDPLLELVCGFLLEDETFMNHYLGRTFLHEDEKKRTALYKIYLFLIMTIECYFRKYEEEDCDKWPRKQLNAAIAELIS